MKLLDIAKKYPELTLTGKVYEDYSYYGCTALPECKDLLDMVNKALRDEISPTGSFFNFVRHGDVVQVRFLDKYAKNFEGVVYVTLTEKKS